MRGSDIIEPGPRRHAAQSPHEQVELQARVTPFGEAFVRAAAFVPEHVHGALAIDSVFAHGPEFVSRIAPRRVTAFDVRDALFLDTETTGLAGGAGTLAFLVGLGFFADDGSFVVEQYFLKDPAREAAMLTAIDKRVNERSALVTFNGKAFDVPLLETRFTLSRIAPSFEDKTHLDLLLPARRFWRGALSSCSLSSLEFHLLGVERSQQDIAGFLIPQLYREYLQARRDDLSEEMSRVMYHNLHDILSMVTLITRMCDLLARPRDVRERAQAGEFYERAGAVEEAERVYVDTLREDSANATRNRLARMLKRQKRHSEATPHWQQLADGDSFEALLELAKHFEWRARDIPQALANALRARAVCPDAGARAELEHRIARLEKKLSAVDAGRNTAADTHR
jgi:hypothetical protein